MTEEFVRYLEMCVNFHHENDESFKINDSAYEKENLMYLKTIHYINELYNDVEENHTNEQDCGENRVEGGVLSVSGSVSEKHYRQFEDTAELMVHYSKHFNIDFPPFYEPIIWVKRKDNDSRFLITGYDELDVLLEDCWQDLNDLCEQYVFLDGSPVGKLEE